MAKAIFLFLLPSLAPGGLAWLHYINQPSISAWPAASLSGGSLCDPTLAALPKRLRLPSSTGKVLLRGLLRAPHLVSSCPPSADLSLPSPPFPL